MAQLDELNPVVLAANETSMLSNIDNAEQATETAGLLRTPITDGA